jgi:alkylated DNA repair dioxygenase AlkB
MKIEIPPGHSIEYIEGFLSKEEADDALRALLATDMTPEIIRMFGRDTVTKRKSEQFGVQYDYNPTAKKAKPWTPLMVAIKAHMEAVAGPLDGGLIQVYSTGEAGIGWHRDAGNPEVIASLSLGAERDFAFGTGPVSKCAEVYRMRLAHGSLLLIPGNVNEALKHRVPPERQVKEPRINITLRRFPQ